MKINITKWLGLTLITIICFLAHVSYADTPPNPAKQEIVGKVTWIKGSFKAIAADQKARTLEQGAPIYLHDTLVTNANTTAGIVFTDNTLMTFRENTKFYIDQYAFNPQSTTKSVGKYVMNLIEGGFRTIDGLIARKNPRDYSVHTAIATIGVRGTEYAVYFSKGQVYMNFYSGQPFISNEKGTMELSKDKPYIFVPGPKAAPIQLPQQPDVFKQPLPIVPAVMTPPEQVSKVEPTNANISEKTTDSNKAKVVEAQGSDELDKLRKDESIASGGGICGAKSSGGFVTGFTLKLN